MMNNAAFHLSGAAAAAAAATPRQQPLMMLPSHSPPNPPRLMSSSEAASFGMALAANNANMAAAAGLANSALNFGGHHHRDLLHFGALNPAFSYLNGFNGLPMMQMGFGLFNQHSFMSKSPGMVSPGFFGPFGNNKDDDASWQKSSPNTFPDSPRSGSRGSPMDNHLRRSKLPKGKSPPEQIVCPLCKETVGGKSLNEHFMEELKTYRQEPLNTRVVSSSSPNTAEHTGRSAHSGHAPGENDARLEIYLRVRGNRRTRCPSNTSASSYLPGNNASTSRRSSASSSTGSTRSSPVVSHPCASTSKRSKHKRIEAIQVEDAEVIVDVEVEDDGEHQRDGAPLRIDSSPTGQLPVSDNRSPLHNLWNQSDLPRKKRPIDTAEDFTEKKSITSTLFSPSPSSDSASV
ncbi:hypothetical protein RvY_03460 [Ramazzottius varieornatus]|uniref:E3 ubiquitin-protein ligase RNF220 middle domain-containing protein n=1 Tax=Ramazzottius varieornatus TaxID=947166 RepID=A0A1D1UN52_RAMVA|nr:hypothetical protein RvY_03460 [Ramazzottius varieornatus]